MASSESVDKNFILSASIVLFQWPGAWFDFLDFVVPLISLCVPFLIYGVVNIWKQVFIGE